MPKTIKELPEHGRPREKMRDRGPAALTDEELVSAIVGMGTAGVDVRSLSRKVVALIREHREALTLDHLRSVPGMGIAKSGQILSAFELGRRYLLSESTRISCAEDVLPMLSDIRAETEECQHLKRSRSQIVILKKARGTNIKYQPFAFTEHGVLMLSSVLKSQRAVQVNIQIMRTFVRLREMLASNETLIERLHKLEENYDAKFKIVFSAIRQLMNPRAAKRKPIGFHPRAAEE